MQGSRHRHASVPAVIAAVFGCLAAFLPRAAAAVSPVALATVEVICDARLGTGALTSLADGGYVLTVGHVALDPATLEPAGKCRVGFVTDDTLRPTVFFEATIVHAIFDAKTDRDMAVLKVGQKAGGGQGTLPAEVLKTNEFASPGDGITVHGFPSGGSMKTATGKILGFSRGMLLSDAPISSGYSGGPAVDASGHVVGVAERVSYEIDETTGAQKVIDYELSDIMAVIGWLDAFGPREHDKYLAHADPARFDGAPFVFRDEDLGCAHVVRTADSPTLYCLLDGPYRLVFPTEKTFFSWFPDFTSVVYVAASNLADYQLVGNVTMKAGSLVKIQTDPRVYVVTDSIGTLRWVQTEDRARELFGDAWATKVSDVPVEFFANYRVGEPVE